MKITKNQEEIYSSRIELDYDIEQLRDLNDSGEERPWRSKRLATELLSMAYDSVDEGKANRLRGCATQLGFAVLDGGKKRLKEANFCRVRLCPMCTWRRSLKVYGQARQIIDTLDDYCFMFATLTIKNVKGEDLSEAIDGLFAAWNKFYRKTRIVRAWRGGMRTLEVTHNVNPASKDYDTYHPHLHVLVAVRKSYFRGRDYISQADYAEMWRDAARLDYVPIVHVEKCKSTTAAALAECCKYAVKDTEYILPDDWDLSIDTVRVLNSALHGRRLVSWFGVFADARKNLKLDDAEAGDLVLIDGNDENSDEAHEMVYYAWCGGYSQYRRRREF